MGIHDEFWDKKQIKRLAGGYVANKKRHDQIISYINKSSKHLPRKGAVLNIGIGNGNIEEILLSKNYVVCSLDPSWNAVTILSEKLGLSNDLIKAGSVEKIPFDSDSFDFVVMSEVIEHLEDGVLHNGLKEVRRVLKSDGVLVGTVPCNEDLSRETFSCPVCQQSFHRVGHVKSYIPETLRELLSSYFKVEKCHRFLGMHLNWKGYLQHQWNDLPFKIIRLFKPNVRALHQREFSIFFTSRKIM